MELIFVALISASSAILGAALSAIATYKVTSRQVSAAREQLALQLLHSSKEARRERLIKARQDVLLRLREVCSEWVQKAEAHVTAAFALKFAAEGATAGESLREEFQRFEKATTESQEASTQLAMLRGQLSDSELDRLVGEASDAQEQAGLELVTLTRKLHAGSVTAEVAEGVYSELKDHSNRLRERTRAVAQRIELLLTGENAE